MGIFRPRCFVFWFCALCCALCGFVGLHRSISGMIKLAGPSPARHVARVRAGSVALHYYLHSTPLSGIVLAQGGMARRRKRLGIRQHAPLSALLADRQTAAASSFQKRAQAVPHETRRDTSPSMFVCQLAIAIGDAAQRAATVESEAG